MNESFGKRLLPCLALALGTAMAVLGTVPGGASASTAPPHLLRPGARTVPGAKMSLAQAPAGLRAVVRRTVRAPAAAGSAFQQAKVDRLRRCSGRRLRRLGGHLRVHGGGGVPPLRTRRPGRRTCSCAPARPGPSRPS